MSLNKSAGKNIWASVTEIKMRLKQLIGNCIFAPVQKEKKFPATSGDNPNKNGSKQLIITNANH